MFAFSQGRVVQAPEAAITTPAVKRPLAEADAVDIWIARWLRVRRKELVARYACDPRRLYEIWEEKRFFGSGISSPHHADRDISIEGAVTRGAGGESVTD